MQGTGVKLSPCKPSLSASECGIIDARVGWAFGDPVMSPIKRPQVLEYPHTGPFAWVFKEAFIQRRIINNSIQLMEELWELNELIRIHLLEMCVNHSLPLIQF